MRILGSLSDRSHEVHLTSELEDPPQVEVRWKQGSDDRRVKRAHVALFTWDHIAGDDVPDWLFDELKNHERYLIIQWSARYRE